MGDRDYTFYTYEIRNMLWNMLLLNDVCRSIEKGKDGVKHYVESYRKTEKEGMCVFLRVIFNI